MAISREAEQVPEVPNAADNNRPSDTQLMDVFDGMEDAVRRQVAERLRGTTACPATTDEKSGDELPPASHSRRKPVSGRLRTVDNTVVSQVTWPHELIYSPSGQPAVYETLSTMSFVNGYIEVLNTVSQDTKVHMLSHLQELIVDGETYG